MSLELSQKGHQESPWYILKKKTPMISKDFLIAEGCVVLQSSLNPMFLSYAANALLPKKMGGGSLKLELKELTPLRQSKT